MAECTGTREGTGLAMRSHAEPPSLCLQPECTLIYFHAELNCCHGKQKGPSFSIKPAHASRQQLRGARTSWRGIHSGFECFPPGVECQWQQQKPRHGGHGLPATTHPPKSPTLLGSQGHQHFRAPFFEHRSTPKVQRTHPCFTYEAQAAAMALGPERTLRTSE